MVQDLPAGGLIRLQTEISGKARIGTVVVDGKIHPALVCLGTLGEQPLAGNVHADHRFRSKTRRGQSVPPVGGKEGGGILVGQNMGGLAQLSQGQTQSHGAAHRIPVGPLVGKDKIAVPLCQPLGGLLYAQGHSLPSRSRSSMT